MKKVGVLFVCMGNICRSPTAQGVFQRLVKDRGLETEIYIDSAGTHAYHIGESPDRRAQAASVQRKVDLSMLRARQVEKADFRRFDYLLAMDRSNLSSLQRLAAVGERERIHLLMDFARRWNEREVPDPYYGGEQGFERALDMVEDAADGLLAHLLKHHF